MGLTKKGKILLTSLGVLLAIASIVAFAVSIERIHQLESPPEKPALQRLEDIKDSLSRAREKMMELIDSSYDSSEGEESEESQERSKRDTGAIRHLVNSVNHLTKSLSDFAEVLNQSGFSNILSRYEKDLESFSMILEEIEANNGSVSRESLEKVKIIGDLFSEDETNLMNTEEISSEQAEAAKTVVETMEKTENLTATVCDEIANVLETTTTTQIDDMSVDNTTQTSTLVDDIDMTENTTMTTSIDQVSETEDTTTTTELSTIDELSETEGTTIDDAVGVTEIETSTETAETNNETDFRNMANFPLLLFDL